MATKITTTLIDDLDGTDASETLTFSIEGIHYEIDLNEKHAAEFKANLAVYVSAARRMRGGAVRRSSSAPSMKDVRAWARAKGIEVKPRGRLSEDIVRQYQAGQQ